MKNKGGRPTVYTEEKAAEILTRMIEGEAVTTIAKSSHLPSAVTIIKWSVGSPGAAEDFPERYQAAQQLRGERAAGQVQDIIDKVEKGELDANQARVMMDGAKWVAARMHPTLYGDRREHNHKHEVVHSIRDRLDRATNRIEATTEILELPSKVIEA